MHEQLFDRDLALAVGGKFGNVVRHLVLQPQLAPLDEDHHARRRGERLGERRHVEHRVESHRSHVRLNATIPVRPLEHDAASPADGDHAAGHIAVLQ